MTIRYTSLHFKILCWLRSNALVDCQCSGTGQQLNGWLGELIFTKVYQQHRNKKKWWSDQNIVQINKQRLGNLLWQVKTISLSAFATHVFSRCYCLKCSWVEKKSNSLNTCVKKESKKRFSLVFFGCVCIHVRVLLPVCSCILRLQEELEL